MSTLDDVIADAGWGSELVAGDPIPLPTGRALYTDSIIVGNTGSGGSALAAAIAARVLACDPAPRLVILAPDYSSGPQAGGAAWAQAFPQAEVLPLPIDDGTLGARPSPEGCQRALTLVHSVALEAERHLLLKQRRTLLVLDDAGYLAQRMALPFPLERTITTITQVQEVDDLLDSAFGRLLLESASTFWIGSLSRASAEVPGLGRLPRHRQQHTAAEARDFLLIHPRAGLIRSVLVRREDVPAAFLRATAVDPPGDLSVPGPGADPAEVEH